jgi:hypothetical protein
MFKPWQRFLIGLCEIIDGFSAVVSLGFYHSVLSYYIQNKFISHNYYEHSLINVRETDSD